MNPWDAEISLGLAEARALIERVHPEPSVGHLEWFAEGWDNLVFRVDGEWLYRFPRRAIAVAGLVVEGQALGRLAEYLPLPVPVPVALGDPSDGFPWPYFGYRALPGRELANADLSEASLALLAKPLGRFLRALHAPELADELGPQLPGDVFRRADMNKYVTKAEERVTELEKRGYAVDGGGLRDVIRATAGLGRLPSTAVVHGDLHLRHVLVDAAGAITGIIDWGDVHLGNPCVDLQVYWAIVPPAARGAFLEAYGPVDQRTLAAARVLAVFIASVLVLSAKDFGLPAVESASLEALGRIVA